MHRIDLQDPHLQGLQSLMGRLELTSDVEAHFCPDAALRPKLSVFCRLVKPAFASGEVFLELGLTGSGRRAFEITDSTEVQYSSYATTDVAFGLIS